MNYKLKMWQLAFLAFLVVGTVLVIRQQRSAPYQHDTGFVFGTVYNITYQSQRNLKEEIERELKRVDAEFSMFNDTSTVSRINRGEAPALSPMFTEVLALAMDVSRQTDGAFDVTVAPLVNAWGFGFKHEQTPTPRQVDSLRQLVGYQKLSLQPSAERPRSVRLGVPGMTLDFSAIAKGYGVTAVGRLLRRHDVRNYMVEIGGEVSARGVSPRRVAWKIGVTKPTDDSLGVGQELQAVLGVTDVDMATSGNYRNFYYKGGRKYAHTIDPKTGYPVQHSLLSATVLAGSCVLADAYATAFMVMGLDKAKALLQRHPELAAYLVYADSRGENAVWCSPSLKEKLAQ